MLKKFQKSTDLLHRFGPARLALILYRTLSWAILSRVKKTLLCETTGGVMRVRCADSGISRELYRYGVHEPKTSEFIFEALHPGFKVLEIGANIGYFALIEARAIGPRGRIVALEPTPDSFRLLRTNLEVNGVATQVILHQWAAGSRDGTAILELGGNANCNQILRDSDPKGGIEVPMRNLDRALAGEGPFDFVRMDLEGYETEVIKGIEGILRRDKPLICMEVHPDGAPLRELREMLAALSNIGYHVSRAYTRTEDYVTLYPELEIHEELEIESSSVLQALLKQPRAFMAWFMAADRSPTDLASPSL